MSNIVRVGIAEMKVSDSTETVISAQNLGSCLGIAVYDAVRKVGAMAHCLLPMSKSDPEKAKQKPFMYVDTGTAKLLQLFLDGGSNKRDLRIYVAGGAQINDPNDIFQIGKKNVTVLRKILWKNNLLIRSLDVGKDYSRTISLHLDTGKVFLRSQGSEQEMIEGEL